MKLYSVEIGGEGQPEDTWLYRWNVASYSLADAVALAEDRAKLLNSAYPVEVRSAKYVGHLLAN